MPKVKFLSRYTHQLNDSLFGLRDDGSGTPAYIDLMNREHWTAEVINENRREVLFTPVDNHIEIRRVDGTMERRCDAMLIVDREELIFVELKDQMSNWLSDAIEQLEITIGHFAASHQIDNYKRRYAYAANRKHKHFAVSQKSRKQEFFNRTKFILLIQNTITI